MLCIGCPWYSKSLPTTPRQKRLHPAVWLDKPICSTFWDWQLWQRIYDSRTSTGMNEYFLWWRARRIGNFGIRVGRPQICYALSPSIKTTHISSLFSSFPINIWVKAQKRIRLFSFLRSNAKSSSRKLIIIHGRPQTWPDSFTILWGRRDWCWSEASIDIFRGSKIARRSVGLNKRTKVKRG